MRILVKKAAMRRASKIVGKTLLAWRSHIADMKTRRQDASDMGRLAVMRLHFDRHASPDQCCQKPHPSREVKATQNAQILPGAFLLK